MDLQPAGHAGRGRPGGGGHRPGSAPRGPAGRLLPAVLRRRDPRVRLRTTARQALRRPAARGADAAAASGGALGLRRNHRHRKQVAGARHHAPRDPIILHLAPSPDVLRGLPGPPAGQALPAAEGARRPGLRHLRLPRGPGGAAGLDEPAGAPLSLAAPGGRGERGLPSPSQGPPGSARLSAGRASRNISASSARRPSPRRRASWTTSSPQSFSAQAQNVQALCLECHRNKTAYSHATTLESRFSRRAYEAYVESPRLPPLVFKLNSHKPDHICHGSIVL